MSLKGNFKTFYIATILQLLTSDGKTGVLSIVNDDKKVQVFLKNGVIIYATGSHVKNQLGFLLRTNGIISQEQLDECLEISVEKKQAIGKSLYEKNYITKKELKEYLHKQVENIIYELFRWKEGSFEYKDATQNLDGMKIIELNTLELIVEATRRVDEMQLLVTQIPDDQMVFKISENTRSDNGVVLKDEESCLLAMVDGVRTVRNIIAQSGYDEFQAYKILNSLLLGKRIQKRQVAGSNLHIEDVFMKIKDIDSKQLRKDLDDLGLSRSSVVRLSLTRIFRNPTSPEDLLQVMSREAVNIKTEKNRMELESLKGNGKEAYLLDVIHFLSAKIEEIQ